MDNRTIPVASLDKHIAFLGATGSGKTSVAKAIIIEPALDRNERVIIVDPTAAYWGLRLSKNGKNPGYAIPIFGGDHADYPLNTKDAATLGEAYGTSHGSAIFDTSLMTVEARTVWFTAFAETLLRKNRGKLNLVIDECHLFMPKSGSKGGGPAPRMLHAANNLASLGRGKGFRITLISQRPAKVHNDSLSCAKTLIAMQMVLPHDRNAVKDWIEDQADPALGKEIIASLPSLKPGEGWVWYPLGGYLHRAKFPWPQTFDSSAAPDDAQGDGPELAPINLDALKGKLAHLEEEKKGNDPVALRAEVARLKSDLQKTQKNIPENIPDAKATGEAEQRGYTRGESDAAPIWFRRGVEAAIDEIKSRADIDLIAFVQKQMATWKLIGTVRAPVVLHSPAAITPPRRQVGQGNGTLEKPLQKIIDAVRWWNVFGLPAPSHAQVAFAAGYSHKSGTWATYLSRLRSMELIEGRGELILTRGGSAVAHEPEEPPTADRLRAMVVDKLATPLVRILTPVLEVYPAGLGHQEAADRAGYSHSSGTWAAYLSRLRSLDLIEGRGELKAQGWLFP